MKSWSKSLFSTCHYNPGPETTYNFSINTIKKTDNGPPELIGWRRTCEDAPEKSKKQRPKRSLSLSPGWKLRGSHRSLDSLTDVEDEVELFLEKYVLPLQDESSSDLSQIATSEYDSGFYGYLIHYITINVIYLNQDCSPLKQVLLSLSKSRELRGI